MKPRYGFLALMLGIALAASSLPARAADQTYDDRWYIAPGVSFVYADHARQTDNGTGLRVEFGKPIAETWNIEGGINDYKLDFKSPLTGSTHQTAFDVNGLWFFFDRPRVFAPFLLVGGGVTDQNPDFGTSSTDPNLTVGAGFLSIPWDGWDGAIRVQVQHLKMFRNGNFGDSIFSVGLQIPLGTRAAPAPAAATPAPEPPAAAPAAPVEMSPEMEQAAELPHVILLKGVNFDHDSDVLTADSHGVLDEAVQTLKDHPGVHVMVAGYTDNVGDAAYNVDLSHRRAESVEKYLIDHGVDSARLSAKGFGEEDPIASNDTPEGRLANRRVELIVESD
ncbi:MAG TPA: OmpA family protein [Gammaproteobacteria bacterium]|nr:OmpA family protein [Gammaproteobacteria bacterium]